MNEKPRFITPKEAIGLLNDGKLVHTFRNPNGMILGADWDRADLIKTFNENSDKIELSGVMASRMKHGIIVNDGSPLFVETNEEKLNAFKKEQE